MTEGTVLVTRPAGQADALLAALRGEGLDTLHEPMVVIEPLPRPSQSQRSLLLDLDRFAHVIFVSANAVRLGMEWIGDFWPQLPAGLHWYTVGEASAALLEGYGISVHYPGGRMTSEALLALPTLQAPQGERVLLVKGEGGRTVLRDRLSERGAQVDTLSCYRRTKPDLSGGALRAKLARQPPSAVLLSSGEGLCNFTALLGEAGVDELGDAAIVVPGERVAGMAREQGYSRVVVAENATDAAMLAAVLGIGRD